MKKIATLILMALLVATAATTYAQIDKAKMDRDLRVASGVLASLMNNDSDQLFRGGEPEGNYIEGFGVVFTVEDNMVFRYNYKFEWDAAKEAKREVERAQREIERAQREVERAQREMERIQKEEKDKLKSKDKEKAKSYSVSPSTPPAVVAPSVAVPEGRVSEEQLKEYKVKYNNANKEFNKNLKEAFEIFLVDYSQLLSQLKPTDKILITTKSNSDYVFYYSGSEENNVEQSRLSAEMLVKDHKEYELGKLSREKLLDRIKFVENANLAHEPDLDLFSKMLKSTYDQRYTDSYFISSTPKYEFLSGLGIVYSVKVYSSYEDHGMYRLPGMNKSEVSKDEREKLVQQLYPKFKESFKENIIRYGSTIKSWDSGNKLIIKVKMTKCETCTFPGIVEFSVSKEVLEKFLKGSLTLNQAKEKVLVK